MGNTEIAYLKNQITLLREEMKNLLIALLESGLIDTYILELKNVKKLDLPKFWSEAEVEALNYAKARGIGEVPLHYVIVKRRNSGIENAWVIQDLKQWLKEKQ
jgi:hypothetical protein